MRDVLVRVRRALPDIRRWMSDLHARHASASVASGTLGFERLPSYFPAALLKGARAVTVEKIPFPPVSVLGLPEFEGMARIPMAGITFGHMYFVQQEQDREAIHFHELVHVVQWAALGLDAFLSTYALGMLEHGYELSPFEVAAYDLQARFERGDALPEVVESIQWHANETRATATKLFESLGA